jgi:hypothetical protein
MVEGIKAQQAQQADLPVTFEKVGVRAIRASA